MSGRMSIWGVGPRIAAVTAVYAAAAATATWVWPSWFTLPRSAYPYLAAAGGLVLVATIVLHVVTEVAVVRAHGADRLATTGPYAICRNPLYALWILLGLPAIALLLGSWLFLTAALFMYAVTRILVRKEEAYLESRFGDDYRRYRQQVHAVFPTLPITFRRG